MNNGLSRFTFYLQKISRLMNKAREQNNPALWLFNNDARTPFFMLEGLAKIYAGMHNPKRFGKLKQQFKRIEDGLGQIDYYNWLSAAISDKKQIPAGCKQYVKKELDQKTADLNEVLKEKGWLSEDNKRIVKIKKKLNETVWLKPGEEIEAISDFYKASIVAITEFASETNYRFHNVENDVHELRRKLRWLSIYPQALQGAVQYVADRKVAAHVKKYQTKEIINSPFNKLPAAGKNTAFLMLRKSYFMALSWMIDQLGILKDEGLLVKGLCEAIKESTACTKKAALAKAYALLGAKRPKMQEILDDAEGITRIFFKEDNLQHLVARITTSASAKLRSQQ
jgi:TusA-related sulfurtransferase